MNKSLDVYGAFLVLMDDENEHSLWPEFAEVPRDCRVVHGPDTRQGCLDYLAGHVSGFNPRGFAQPFQEPAH